MSEEIESTDPHDWDEMWAWIDGEWKRVRKVEELMGPGMIVESFTHPGVLYNVEWSYLHRGDKPTESP